MSESEIVKRIADAANVWLTSSGAADPRFAGAILAGCVPLTPDASLRRYFRLTLHGSKLRSAVAMWFDSVVCPEASGGVKMNSDSAYVELSGFFATHGVSVPELYFDARAQSILLIEDLGDRALADLIDSCSGDEIEAAFRHAIDQIVAIQKIPRDDTFVFSRAFTPALYRKEMEEFRDYVLIPAGAPPDEIELCERLIETVASELGGLPETLAHRDFHAWNLLLDLQGKLRVIDFQDALLATNCYDVVSLLNDRDMDAALGAECYIRLLRYFSSAVGDPPSLPHDYDRVLLQRDLKVSGRFEKLAGVRGLTQYRRWVPGTLRRLGSTLERMASCSSAPPVYRECLSSFSLRIGTIGEGAGRKLRLFVR